jgi:hypothetical protein
LVGFIPDFDSRAGFALWLAKPDPNQVVGVVEAATNP